MTTLQHNPAPAAEPGAWAGVQIIALGVLGSAVHLGSHGWMVGLAFAAATWSLLDAAMRRAGRLALGPADHVTLARGVLIGGVAALVADRSAHTTVLITLATIALVLDGVDGQVARRTGTSSELGARLDMEMDAFLILVLSVHAAYLVGPWVLAIGGMRYAFVAASWYLPWLRAPLPPRFGRKVVAALQGILLVVVATGFLPGLVAAFALSTLSWSFGRDVLWLWNHRPIRNDRTTSGAAQEERTPHHVHVPA
ncbi:CDP-alcohol phosphatidyltransferase family protein [Pseudonocardiaceae bacterium YIM PH 21723]|nr:CDP-alcohol phosphatidyltransferase family protein [Pseudonocardiaceae bacterium YIM PH 21723]